MKEWKYNDKYVDENDVYRHSKWLNFMNNRLKLAKYLLKNNGIIFISIDDHEVYQLKLLMDRIFREDNFIALMPRLTKKAGKSSDKISNNHDYILVYQKSKKTHFNRIEHFDKGFKYKDKFFSKRGYYKLNQTLDYDSIQYSSSLDYEIYIEGEVIRPGGVSKKEMENRQKRNPERDFCWRWSKELFDFGLKEGFIVVKKYKNKPWRIYTKTYQNVTISKNSRGEYYVEFIPRSRAMSSIDLIDNAFSNDSAKKGLKAIFGKVVFDYPKPVPLIKELLKISTKKESVILDFFAGTGTTGHAVLELNKEDKGNRKFILVTNNENNICTDICYPRIKKVVMGYKNPKGKSIKGLGENLRYFNTKLLNVDHISHVSDEQKIKLTYQAGEMIALREDTFEEVEKNEWWQIFKNEAKYTAIYFKEDKSRLNELVNKLEKLDEKVALYIFSWGKNEYKNEFTEYKNIRVNDIPEPIIDVYKEVNRL